jgi:hypothetical protein
MAKEVCVRVDSGICGLPCQIRVNRIDKRKAAVEITDTECTMLHEMAETIKEIGIKEVFSPTTTNPAYIAAQKAGCHPSCPVPVAILKAAEVALEVALSKSVTIEFVDCD